MAKKSLLQEAIAEAKQVREAAIKNATKELEENLTPSIKEMLANKLEEELDLNESDEESLEESVDSGFKEVKPKSAPKKSVNEEDDPDEDDADEAADDADAAADDADTAADAADDAAADADAEANDADAAAEDEEADDDTPLKDITLGDLKQIISDLVAASAAPAPEGDLGADMDAGDVEGAGEEVPAGDPAATADDAALDTPVDSDADPNSAAAEDDDDEIDISEILRELEEEEKSNKKVCPKCGKENCICKENKANDVMPEDQTGKEHCKPANADSGKDQDQELNELRKENRELKEGLRKCTKTLKEVNLLNAKLTCASKLLRRNLSEAQKANVIKTLDKAKSTEEAETLYSTLLEGLKGSPKNTITESRRGSASKAAGRSTASGVTVDEGMVRRFQQLAGIVKE